METPSHAIYEFGPFHLDPARHVLLRDAKPVTLTPKAFEILVLLLENRGELLTKTDLQSRIWPNTFVDENNLTQQISFLRKTLGENRDQPLYIETVPRVGYRFIAETRILENGRKANGNGAAHASAGKLRGERGEAWRETQPKEQTEFGDQVDRWTEKDSLRQQEAADAWRASSEARPRWRWIAALSAMLVIGIAAAYLFWPIAPPVVVDSTQLTHDGFLKRAALFSDGQFAYFIEVRNGANVLVRVPQAGGDPVAMPAPPVPMIPLDYSPQRREILAIEDGATGASHPVWIFVPPGGPYRRYRNATATAAAWWQNSMGYSAV